MMLHAPTVAAHYCEAMLKASDFDHIVWSRAQPVQITRRWSGTEAPATRHAEVRIIWTEESLLVRFVCRQHEPLVVNSNPQVDRKTIGLWERDVCEIFIAPDPNLLERYLEFEAAPTGEWVDLDIKLTPAGRSTDYELRSGLTTAAKVGNEQVTIVMNVPWSIAIAKPRRGDFWRVNLFRCVGSGNERYLAWQPTYTIEPNFHVPEVFGRLNFD